MERLNTENLFAIWGPSGSGKSILLPRFAQVLRDEGTDVLPIFCGLTGQGNGAVEVMQKAVNYMEHPGLCPVCQQLEHLFPLPHVMKTSLLGDGCLFDVDFTLLQLRFHV